MVEEVLEEQLGEVNQEYIPPQDEIYNVATNATAFDWKHVLEDIIYKNNLDPFDIDISILTKTYLQTIQNLEDLDFSISGKLLTVAVFLLKKKAQYLVDHDISGMDDTLNALQEVEDDEFDMGLDMLEDMDEMLDSKSRRRKSGDYQLKVRNPIARKRKVTLHDLIGALEKTFKQSNQRRKNLLLKNTDVEYSGPNYHERKKKDLKTIIEELFETLLEEFSSKKAHVVFHKHILGEKEHKMSVLDKFIPLLHLHNQEKVVLKQNEHLKDIEIHNNNGE